MRAGRLAAVVLGVMVAVVGAGPPTSGVAVQTTAPPDQTTAARAASAGPQVVARWDMTELNGSPLMLDSSGNGHHGVIGADALAQGLKRDSGIYYDWSLRCPSCPPAAPSRVVQVPDDGAELDIPDPTVLWTAEIRYRTPKGYGNLMQKGQGTTAGGQFKFENPAGLAKCVWNGANGNYIAVRASTYTNDRQWHTVQCVHRETTVEIWVDGVREQVKGRRTGPIDNAKPFVVGGKSSCNQTSVTCDYYTGLIDYIMIVEGWAPS